MTTSLEILEECFDRIYTTRKNVLASKHKSSMKLEDKRKRGKLSTPAHKRELSPARMSRSVNLGDTLTQFQEEELENRPSPTKQTTRNNSQLRTSAPSSSSQREQTNDDAVLNSTTTPKVIENHMDLTPNDLTATVVFDEFRTELMAWLSERQQALLSPSNKSKGSKFQLQKDLVDACADCADYVTDKYLCQKLDPLHSSELVSKVRKTMSKIIEDFAMTAELPVNFEDIRFYEIIGNADQDTHNSAYLKKLTKQLEVDAAASSSSSGGIRRGNSSLVSSIQMSGGGGGGGGGPGSLDTAASGFGLNTLKSPKVQSKEEKEKARIKEQYAQFMQKKPVVQREPEPSPSGIVSDMIGQNRDNLIASSSSSSAAAAAGSSSSSAGRGAGNSGGLGESSSVASNGNGVGTTKTQGMTSGQAVASKDTAKAKELEGLNDDIRTLLSSIQGKSLGEKLALTAPAVMNNNNNAKK